MTEDTEHSIEISADLDILANIAFWVDKTTWEKMSEDEQRAAILERITSVNGELSNDVVRFNDANLSATILSGDSENPIDLNKVQIYDPKA